jgi:hypothetical protein
MGAERQTRPTSPYTQDFVAWVEQTVAQLQAHDFDHVDWENLIEEVADMSRRERRHLESNLIVILLHLLKWQYQPDRRTGSWKSSLREHRRRVNRDRQDSPSLQPYLEDSFSECYSNARDQAADETGLEVDRFPRICPYTIEQVLSPDFLPQ